MKQISGAVRLQTDIIILATEILIIGMMACIVQIAKTASNFAPEVSIILKKYLEVGYLSWIIKSVIVMKY